MKWLFASRVSTGSICVTCFLVYLGLTSLTTLSRSVMAVSKCYNSAILNIHLVISSQDCPSC